MFSVWLHGSTSPFHWCSGLFRPFKDMLGSWMFNWLLYIALGYKRMLADEHGRGNKMQGIKQVNRVGGNTLIIGFNTFLYGKKILMLSMKVQNVHSHCSHTVIVLKMNNWRPLTTGTEYFLFFLNPFVLLFQLECRLGTAMQSIFLLRGMVYRDQINIIMSILAKEI